VNEKTLWFIDDEEERTGSWRRGPFKVLSQVIGIGLLSKKDLKRIKACRGRCRGTS
jgi:hypothetical protein